MDLKDFEKMFHEKLIDESIDINNVSFDKFRQFMLLLLDWNTKINLTAIKDENEFIDKHFIDSLTVLKYFKDNDRYIDIGTGGGFPGIPLKIANPTLKGTLIDSVNKKILVNNDVISKLGLKDIEALHVRAEDLAFDKKYREVFDVAISRAVANLTTLVEYMIPFVKVGGKIICMKGPGLQEELSNAKNAIKILGGEVESIETLNIGNEYERNILIIKKVKSTNIKYPRKQGKPLKEPLK